MKNTCKNFERHLLFIKITAMHFIRVHISNISLGVQVKNILNAKFVFQKLSKKSSGVSYYQ
jgi:hypothetical protein